LIRSVRRGQLLAAKALALYTHLTIAMAVFFVVATVAGVIAWGFNPVVNISGHQLTAIDALLLGAASVLVYLLPVIALASFGLFLSVATRQSVAVTGGAMIRSLWVSAAFALPPLFAASVIFIRRDVTT
jgi:ABC-type transport system involved in multi-copper enzyme maturation permease subunit